MIPSVLTYRMLVAIIALLVCQAAAPKKPRPNITRLKIPTLTTVTAEAHTKVEYCYLPQMGKDVNVHEFESSLSPDTTSSWEDMYRQICDSSRYSVDNDMGYSMTFSDMNYEEQPCLEKSRVKMQDSQYEYINANWIDSYRERQAYIATQCPFSDDTIAAFWNMVWTQQAQVIVKLNNDRDRSRKQRCANYWTDGKYGEVVVKLVDEHDNTDLGYTKTQLELTVKDNSRVIHLYRFKDWADDGVVEDMPAFLAFVAEVKSAMTVTSSSAEPSCQGGSVAMAAATPSESPKRSTPLVVHCAAGQGRTGVFVVLMVLISGLTDSDDVSQGGDDTVNFKRTVHGVRTQRANSVRNWRQLQFVAKAFAAYLRQSI